MTKGVAWTPKMLAALAARVPVFTYGIRFLGSTGSSVGVVLKFSGKEFRK